MKVLLRRLILFPLYFILAALLLVLAPGWMLLFGVIDLVKGLTTLRWVGYFCIYLWVECAGLVLASGAWVVQQIRRAPRGKYLDILYRIQGWWGGKLLSIGAWIFKLRFEFSGTEALDARGPMLVFIRHASTGDTMLPLAIFSPRRLHLRFVMKKELLFDPCIDLVGNQLPNYFLDRDVGGAEELARVVALAEGLGPDDGVLLYPEGTRFTPRKRARIIEKLREKGDTIGAQRAEALSHVLPPRLGGAIGLLEACDADVIFLMHTGFEGITSLRDLLRGTLMHRTIRAHLVRVPRSEIPTDPDGKVQWLHRRWAEVDAWIARNQEKRQAGGATASVAWPG